MLLVPGRFLGQQPLDPELELDGFPRGRRFRGIHDGTARATGDDGMGRDEMGQATGIGEWPGGLLVREEEGGWSERRRGRRGARRSRRVGFGFAGFLAFVFEKMVDFGSLQIAVFMKIRNDGGTYHINTAQDKESSSQKVLTDWKFKGIYENV